MKTAKKKWPRPAAAFYDFHPPLADLFEGICRGLESSPKRLSPILFYDEAGLQLFNRITTVEEYYLTRTELGILRRHASDISKCLGEECAILEYGSGDSEKVRILLDALSNPRSYVAIDISSRGLADLTRSLAEDYPDLEVVGVCADFIKADTLSLDFATYRRSVAFFPGSSIGNFEPAQATDFLNGVRRTVGDGGGLLIGVDLKKDRRVLQAAYNDERGFTARFNLHMLDRLNREFSANFRLDSFEHRAHYDEATGRVEMHLVCSQNLSVRIRDREFLFDRGESIHTENSYKYGIEEFQELARQAGWTPRRVWTDDANWFSLHYFEKI